MWAVSITGILATSLGLHNMGSVTVVRDNTIDCSSVDCNSDADLLQIARKMINGIFVDSILFCADIQTPYKMAVRCYLTCW